MDYFKLLLAISLLSFSLLNLSQDFDQPQQNFELSTYDCTGVSIEEVDQSKLTTAERIALLDSALLNSVDNYSKCINQVLSQMPGDVSGGNDGYGSGDSDGVDAGSEDEGAFFGNSEEIKTKISNENVNPAKNSNSTDVKRGVIPPKDNDSIVCQLLYDEIVNEKDTTKKSELENQYASYKCGK